MSELNARTALSEVDRVRRRIRARRWWHVASALVMTVALTAYYIAMASWPRRVDDYVLPGVLVTVAVLGFIGWRIRSVDPRAQRLETPAVLVSLALALVTIAVNRFLLPEGLSAGTVLTGLLPGLPFLYLAWRVGRR